MRHSSDVDIASLPQFVCGKWTLSIQEGQARKTHIDEDDGERFVWYVPYYYIQADCEHGTRMVTGIMETVELAIENITELSKKYESSFKEWRECFTLTNPCYGSQAYVDGGGDYTYLMDDEERSYHRI